MSDRVDQTVAADWFSTATPLPDGRQLSRAANGIRLLPLAIAQWATVYIELTSSLQEIREELGRLLPKNSVKSFTSTEPGQVD
jgi:hypothetical protein